MHARSACSRLGMLQLENIRGVCAEVSQANVAKPTQVVSYSLVPAREKLSAGRQHAKIAIVLIAAAPNFAQTLRANSRDHHRLI